LGTLKIKAIKTVTGAKYTEHATHLYVELNVLKLPDLFRHEIAILIHKILRNNHPPNFYNFLLNRIHNRTTRLTSNKHALLHYTFLDIKLKNCKTEKRVSSTKKIKCGT